MKRTMEAVTMQHVDGIYYSVSASIKVGEDKNPKTGNGVGFSPILLEGFSREKLKRAGSEGYWMERSSGGKDQLCRSCMPELQSFG